MDFKIGMVAPSRIGKTSLVTAILSDSQGLLAGTPIVINAKDGKTTGRINQHKSELRGSLRAGEFDSGAMSGTQEPFEFNLVLKQTGQDDSSSLTLRLLDFPGGWISSIQTEDAGGEHAKCAQFIYESSVLMVVVDASIIMEAASPSHKRAIDAILEVPATENIVRSWAKARSLNPTDPALLLICPVKCESYFNDNGGDKNLADALYNAVIEDVYRELLPIINAEGASQAEILYMPVDTVGCVEFVSATWDKEDGSYRFNPHFKVRGNSKISVKGADDVLIAIAKQLVGAQASSKKIIANEATKRAKLATKSAAEDKTWYQDLATFLFDYETDAEERARHLHGQARATETEFQSVGQVLTVLAGRSFGHRVRRIRQEK